MKTLIEVCGLIGTVVTCYAAVQNTAAGNLLAAFAWGVAFVAWATVAFRLDWRQGPPEA